MTLTEALSQSIYVRRKAWPWHKCMNDIERDPKRVWAIRDYPRLNGWEDTLSWEDAIATDWEALENTP